jgi:hypothetical protein
MFVGLAALAYLFALPAAQTGPAPEWLYQASPSGFEVGFEAAQGPISIVEQVPKGETVQNWSRMVTTQRFAGATPKGLSSDIFAGGFITRLGGGCPGVKAGEVRTSTAEGRIVAELRADCPLNPGTGKPETLFLRAISGPADLHVVQVAFRHVPTSAEASWAERHLSTVTLCDGNSTASVCRRR